MHAKPITYLQRTLPEVAKDCEKSHSGNVRLHLWKC